MADYEKFISHLKMAVGGNNNIAIISATVLSVQGESCTVDYEGLEIDEVRLKATINGATNYLIATPKKGSIVLIGSLTGDLKDLCVLKCDEIETLDYSQNGLKVSIDSVTGKISLSNSTVSLFGILNDLTTLLKTFQVYTAMGPSGTAIATTLTKIIKFETDFKQLLI